MLKKELKAADQRMTADALDDQDRHHCQQWKQDCRIFRQLHFFKDNFLSIFFITGTLFFLQKTAVLHFGYATCSCSEYYISATLTTTQQMQNQTTQSGSHFVFTVPVSI
ncbi:MAG: hypothetical protein ACLR6B_18265 [Blautia sp.]